MKLKEELKEELKEQDYIKKIIEDGFDYARAINIMMNEDFKLWEFWKFVKGEMSTWINFRQEIQRLITDYQEEKNENL